MANTRGDAPQAATAADTEGAAPMNVPPAGLGLLTKLNTLIISLILATALGITFYLVRQEITSHRVELERHGRSTIAILVQLASGALTSGDKSSLDQVLDGLRNDPEIAYISITDQKRQRIASRAYGNDVPLELRTGSVAPATVQVNPRELSGFHYLEFLAPVESSRPATADEAEATAGSAAPREVVGYVRIGMNLDRKQAQLRDRLIGALWVVALVVAIAIATTLLLTRRLVAPVHLLMRAANAVGIGRLDVFVPARSRDELGQLAHTFNQMIQRLAASKTEVASYAKRLEENVSQRTRELELATARAYKLAQHDILTGLPNRALLNQRLKQIVAQAQREHHHVACLFLDFDHFKRINDTLGHDAGDQMLVAVAKRLTSAVRKYDTVARLGGDEFVVVLPRLVPDKAMRELLAVLSRIRESFLAPFKLGDQTPTLQCSIGVSMYPADADEPGTLIKQADTAMYAAKESGRNAYRFYTADMNTRVLARLQLETDMRRGLMDDEFFLVYQPLVEMESSRAVAVEALLRWRDPFKGIINPADFISVAEESGMIHTLGARALRDACQQVMSWHRQDMLLRLSVNVSVQQLEHERWLDIVTEALSSTGLPPGYLGLEITESVIITHPERAVGTLVKLRALGVSITIDDFGTGYSSLSYLTQLPIQSVKIDQRFVHGIEQHGSDAAITQAIIALSHSLRLRVIAEGVETIPQFEFLKQAGCEEAQGFLIARPMPPEELQTWWRMQEQEHRIVGRQDDLWRRDTPF